MKKLIVILAIMAVAVGGVVAQVSHDVTITVPTIRMVGLSSTATITLAVSAPVTAGDVPTGATNATKYLQYTVLNPAAATTRIQVRITAGTVPAGTNLAVAATDASPLGTMGSVATIDGTAASLITLIPSGNTGSGGTDGALLTYTLTVPTPADLVENGAGATVTLQYTIIAT